MVVRMSHSKEEGRGGSGCSMDDDNICRDFLRNVCRRGKRCKFKHPEEAEPGPAGVKPNRTELTFCHDYQNGLCSRPMCRFIHCTCEDEDFCLRTGDIPPHILDQAIRKGQLGDVTLNGDIPICKDFLMGECSRRRGGKCKFRHITKSEYEAEIYGHELEPHHYDPTITHEPPGPPDPKRQRFESKPPMPPEFPREREFLDGLFGRDINLRDFRDRDRERNKDRRGIEEIMLMRKQIDDLKKENASLKKDVSDLRATNEFLLDQVTTLRLSKAGGSVTAVTVPTVSLASTIPVATSVQPLTAQLSQPITAAQLSQPLPITSDGSVVTLPTGPPRPPPPPQAAQQAQGQSLAPPTQQVAVASGPGVQVQVSMAQSGLTAVSLSTVTLNQMAPATSMAPSMGRMAPATSMAPSMGRPTQNMAISMSRASGGGHLVSYPIMTQPGLRPQLQ